MIRRFLLTYFFDVFGRPTREAAERAARARIMVPEMIQPQAEARIRKRWAGAIRPRFALVRRES